MKLSLGLEVEVGYPQAMKASVCDLRGVAKDRVSFRQRGNWVREQAWKKHEKSGIA